MCIRDSNYTVRHISEKCGDKDTSYLSVPVISTGIKSFEDKIEIEIYPNPVNEILNIRNVNNAELYFTLMDIHGNQILQDNLSLEENKINLSQLASGIYLIRMTDGINILEKKIVIMNR